MGILHDRGRGREVRSCITARRVHAGEPSNAGIINPSKSDGVLCSIVRNQPGTWLVALVSGLRRPVFARSFILWGEAW